MKNENETKLEQRVKAELTEADTEKLYEDMLTDCYGDIDVCGYTMDAGLVLRKCDPIAFNCGESDYIDSLLGDTLREVDGLYYDKAEVDAIENELEQSEQVEIENEESN